jgi:hypothetical protein
MTRRLGRLPHQPEAIAAAPALRYGTEAPPPPTLDRSGIAYQPILADNTTLPTCSVAGLLNGALAVNALAGAGGLSIAPGSWLAFYAALAGCADTRDAIAATDGLVLLDVLRRQGVSGFDIGEVAPLTGDFGTVGLDRVSLARCMAGLGFVYLGVDLFPVDMDTPAGQPWDWHGGDPLSQSVGGHCVCLWDYTGLGDSDFVRIATWGSLQRATWAWIENRAREAHGILYPGIEAPGVDVAGLRERNAAWLMG